MFVPYIVLVTARLNLFRNGTLFLLQNTLSTNVSVVSDQRSAIFFHRHTCLHLSRFFAVSSENICSIYCFDHSSSQSVSQWNSFYSSKYIVYKCSAVSDQGWAIFFPSSHLSRFFRCIIRKYLSHIYLAASSRLLKRKFLHITYCISLLLCWRYQSWRKYLLQLSRRYSATRHAPSEICSPFVQYMLVCSLGAHQCLFI